MDVSTIALGGLQQAQSQLDGAAKQIANSANPLDSVDLSRQAISILEAGSDFRANLATLKVNDQMMQSLFDVLG